METFQVTCSHCGKRMAIAIQDRGSKVQCPHCQQVVQTAAAEPAPTPAPPAPARLPPAVERPAAHESEDIFSSSPETSDDLFGAPPPPRLPLPPDPAVVPERLPVSDAPQPPAPWEQTSRPYPAGPPQAGEMATDAPPGEPAEAPPTDLPSAPAQRARPSHLGAMALIFLVPYAVVMTGAFLYMVYLYRSAQAADPLERMPDPYPKEGGARRVAHDRPLPDKLVTGLGRSLRIGDLEVKPLKVEQNADGDLALRVEMQNVSADTVFAPFPEVFARHLWSGAGRNAPKPYTYLQVDDQRIYGGTPHWFKEPGGQAFSGSLRPGEKMVAVLVTNAGLRDRDLVLKSVKAKAPLLWRLHVRRGLVPVRGEPVSATAVIGVRFLARDISPAHEPV